MVQFRQRLFPERKYRLPLRWVLWVGIVGLAALLGLAFRFLARYR
ncbi:MAG: hypothetical protein ABIK44_01765 [candidate division WOR-3 bacterium]